QAKALEARATTRGDSRDAKQAAEKLKRNTKKLNEVTVEFDKKLSSCCNRMTRAWDDREKMMNGIVARIVHFQESFFAEQLMNSLGVARILSAAEGSGPRWGGTMGIEPFVPKGHVRHYEGELLRKHMVMKERMWYRLVGSSLEVYDMKPKEGRDNTPMYVVTELPVTVYEVKGVTKVSGVNFRVTVLGGGETGGGGLNLYAADEVDGKGWMDALNRASEWDQLASSSKAAGIAPGGEAGVAMAGAAAAAAVMAAKAKGKGGKKGKEGDGGGEKNPELANDKKGGEGRGGGGWLPPGLTGPGGPVGGMGGGVGIGGSFNSRTGRAGLGPSGGGMSFGMMGSHMNPPSFSGSSFSGSTHSHSSMSGGLGGGGGGSQMGDPRLHMAAQQMGMSSNGRSGGGPGGPPMGPMPPHFDPPQVSGPPVNPSTGLPVGMRQNGPPIVLPAGMVPRGGGPVVNPPIPPPSMPGPSMPGPWGSTPQQQQQQPGGGWGGGGGGGGLGPSRSFTSRYGMKQGAAGRQQGFRRSSSFGDWMGPSGVGQPLSPTMEVDSFETQSTRSAPPFGATAAVGDATAAAEAATAAAAKVAAGGHVTGTEETKSSTKDKKGDDGADKANGAKAAAAAAVTAAAAARAAAGAAAAGSKSAEPSAAVPAAPAPGAITIQTIHTKKDAPPAPAPAPAAESKKSAPAANAAAAAAAAAIPLSDLLKRGDDGGLSRYDTSSETPARARSKPASTWKRMMSLGGGGSSYRYDGGDAGVSGEGKSSAEEVSESDRCVRACAVGPCVCVLYLASTAQTSRQTNEHT
ncbi:unnamed protein product, partial [Ectocarpus sp. 12 AP-2014]